MDLLLKPVFNNTADDVIVSATLKVIWKRLKVVGNLMKSEIHRTKFPGKAERQF